MAVRKFVGDIDIIDAEGMLITGLQRHIAGDLGHRESQGPSEAVETSTSMVLAAGSMLETVKWLPSLSLNCHCSAGVVNTSPMAEPMSTWPAASMSEAKWSDSPRSLTATTE